MAKSSETILPWLNKLYYVDDVTFFNTHSKLFQVLMHLIKINTIGYDNFTFPIRTVMHSGVIEPTSYDKTTYVLQDSPYITFYQSLAASSFGSLYYDMDYTLLFTPHGGHYICPGSDAIFNTVIQNSSAGDVLNHLSRCIHDYFEPTGHIDRATFEQKVVEYSDKYKVNIYQLLLQDLDHKEKTAKYSYCMGYTYNKANTYNNTIVIGSKYYTDENNRYFSVLEIDDMDPSFLHHIREYNVSSADPKRAELEDIVSSKIEDKNDKIKAFFNSNTSPPWDKIRESLYYPFQNTVKLEDREYAGISKSFYGLNEKYPGVLDFFVKLNTIGSDKFIFRADYQINDGRLVDRSGMVYTMEDNRSFHIALADAMINELLTNPYYVHGIDLVALGINDLAVNRRFDGDRQGSDKYYIDNKIRCRDHIATVLHTSLPEVPNGANNAKIMALADKYHMILTIVDIESDGIFSRFSSKRVFRSQTAKTDGFFGVVLARQTLIGGTDVYSWVRSVENCEQVPMGLMVIETIPPTIPDLSSVRANPALHIIQSYVTNNDVYWDPDRERVLRKIIYNGTEDTYTICLPSCSNYPIMEDAYNKIHNFAVDINLSQMRPRYSYIKSKIWFDKPRESFTSVNNSSITYDKKSFYTAIARGIIKLSKRHSWLDNFSADKTLLDQLKLFSADPPLTTEIRLAEFIMSEIGHTHPTKHVILDRSVSELNGGPATGPMFHDKILQFMNKYHFRLYIANIEHMYTGYGWVQAINGCNLENFLDANPNDNYVAGVNRGIQATQTGVTKYRMTASISHSITLVLGRMLNQGYSLMESVENLPVLPFPYLTCRKLSADQSRNIRRINSNPIDQRALGIDYLKKNDSFPELKFYNKKIEHEPHYFYKPVAGADAALDKAKYDELLSMSRKLNTNNSPKNIAFAKSVMVYENHPPANVFYPVPSKCNLTSAVIGSVLYHIEKYSDMASHVKLGTKYFSGSADQSNIDNGTNITADIVRSLYMGIHGLADKNGCYVFVQTDSSGDKEYVYPSHADEFTKLIGFVDRLDLGLLILGFRDSNYNHISQRKEHKPERKYTLIITHLQDSYDDDGLIFKFSDIKSNDFYLNKNMEISTFSTMGIAPYAHAIDIIKLYGDRPIHPLLKDFYEINKDVPEWKNLFIYLMDTPTSPPPAAKNPIIRSNKFILSEPLCGKILYPESRGYMLDDREKEVLCHLATAYVENNM